MCTQAEFMAVGAAAVVNFIVGMIWYAPPVLGDKWMKLAKVKPDPKAMAKTMVYGLLRNTGMLSYSQQSVETGSALP